MGYASESNNKGWGLPIGLLALILMIALMGTAGAPTSAFAADISCGQCHGTLDNGTNAVTSNTTDRRGVTEPGYESKTIPTQDNGIRGLHGTHMNYSSATYGAAGTQTITGISGTFSKRGNCSYCHNGHPRHATGFVNFTAAATITAVATQPLLGNKYLMVYTSAGRGVSYKNNIPSLVVNPTGNCTVACHKGTSRSNPAPWGNYTTSSIKLSCASCHDDSSNINSTTLSGNHKNHLLANTTTPSTYGLMSAGSNAGCNNCHKNNANDFWTAANRVDNGTRKAYPHAIDGTNVTSSAVGTNGMAGNLPTINGGSGSTATCSTNACHSRVTTVQWGAATIDCNMCHYYALSPLDTDNNSIPAGALSAGHNPHFKSVNRLACNNCHPDHSAEAAAGKLAAGHARKLPAAAGSATILASLSYTGGTSGTCSNTGGFCHGAGVTPAYGTTGAGCGACHYYPGAPSGRDNWSTGNGHNVRYNTTLTNKHMRENAYFHYSSASETFTAVTGDKDKCGLCHRNVKIHRNGTNFAHLSSWTGSTYSQCGTTPFTFTINGLVSGVGNGPSDTAKCNNVKCHNGSGKQTPVWW